MHSRWTTLLLSTALAGGIAVTTGIAAGHAATDRHPAVQPAVAAPDPAKVLDVTGKLGAVLAKVNELTRAAAPAAGTPVDPAALKAGLGELGTASDQLKSALPAAAVPLPAVPGSPSAPALPSSPAVPPLPGAPSVPAVGGAAPVQVLSGGPLQRVLPPLPVSVEDTLADVQKHAGTLVADASAKQPDAAAVKNDLSSLATADLALLTGVSTRMTGA
ncbi:hypothetical protein ACFW1A_18770 [Kitasatospora sp. NPDC058965]|uniref:hypothetical protein n=1 Tax=Kitasatospora sp. NPDC058965 TaxID=3346682 RepID=UPI0036CF465E